MVRDVPIMPFKKKILYVSFRFAGDPREFEEDAMKLARPLSQVPGLLWKIWMSEGSTDSFGCVYLFEDEDALNRFVDGPICTHIDKQPEFQDIQMRSFDIMEAPSLINRAPIGSGSLGRSRTDKG